LLERRPDLLAANASTSGHFAPSRLPNSHSYQYYAHADGGRLDDRLLSLLNLNPTLFHSALQIYVPSIKVVPCAPTSRSLSTTRTGSSRYGSAALSAFREVEITLNNEGVLGERLAYQQAAEKDRKEAVRIGRIKYGAGVIDMLSLIQCRLPNRDRDELSRP